MNENKQTAKLAYALFDADSTGRLGEEPKEVIDEYFAKANKTLYMLKTYHNSSITKTRKSRGKMG